MASASRSPHSSPCHGKKPNKKSTRRASIRMEHFKNEIDITTSKELANKRVQESDGSFFENFTALSWKQQNRRLRAVSEDEKESEKPPPLDSVAGIKVPSPSLSKKEWEQLYIEVLYTIKHKIGKTDSGHLPFVEDLYTYAQEAFEVSAEDHERLLVVAAEEKAPIIILNIHVIAARELEAKDPNGFSDPYCMLGIMPGRMDIMMANAAASDDELDKKKAKRFSTRRKDRKNEKFAVRDLLPAKFIRATTVKHQTLNPVWKEKFRFDIDGVQDDSLHLDIWDHDDEVSVLDAASKLNEVSGFKGLGRFFKQIAQSARKSNSEHVDDFLGCVNIKLSEIPSTGFDKWFDLEGRSSKSNVQGQIHLHLNLSTREDQGVSEEDNWSEVQQHEALLGVFIDCELKKINDDCYKWSGELSQAALTILHQHAIQGDLTVLQQTIICWLAFSRKHMIHSFDYGLLLKHIQSLENLWTPHKLSKEEEESLSESFNLFIEHCMTLLRKQRDVFPPANKAALNKLEMMLKCLQTIYETKVFQVCCPFQFKDLSTEVTEVIKKGTSEWYEKMSALTQPQMRSDEDTLQSLVSLTNILNTDVQKSIQYLDNLFLSTINVPYFSITYKQLEKLLADDVVQGLEDEISDDISTSMDELTLRTDNTLRDETNPLAQQMGTTMFELYLALQEFVKFKVHLNESEQKSLAILNCHDWFKGAVTRWLNIARHKVRQRIKKAVELDKQVTLVDSLVKHSTSCVDTGNCFVQIKEFWKQLAWPDLCGSFVFITKILDDICSGAIYYVDLVHYKLKSAGYYDDEGQFGVTTELCITINNMEQVRRALKPLPEALCFPKIIAVMEEAHGHSAAKQCKVALHSILKSADEDMLNKITLVVERVGEKMRPDIKKNVFHLAWAPDAVPVDDAIVSLMEYMESSLLTLNQCLLRTNFFRILEVMWTVVLQEMENMVQNDLGTKKTTFYERLYNALHILVDYFHADGDGLALDKIRTTEYMELQELLHLHKTDTRHLIDSYYIQKLESQKKIERTDYGHLSVKVYYNLAAERLFVEVVCAKDVIPLDSNGLSDPYVIVELVPSHYFPSATAQKTRVVYKTLNPLFDETFEFPVAPSQCRHEASMVQFTVMDHDMILHNDFAGEALLPLANIPGLSTETPKSQTLKLCVLPLTNPKASKDQTPDHFLPVLQGRPHDSEAQTFVKKINQRNSMAS